MSIETVAYIATATAAAQEDALLCELLRAAAPLGVALHVAPDAASGFEFLARAVSPPTTVVLAPGPTQPSLAKRVHALVPSALIVCLNGCLQQIRSALSTHARHAVIDTASPHLSKRLASALSRGDHEETVASRQCQAWFPAASGTTCGRHLREVLDENFYQRVEGCVEAALQGVEATCEVPLHRDGAMQAMPLGGALRVIVKNVWLPDEGGSKRRRAHVKVSIVDGGMGIPEAHLCRIFDPYFTMKQSGSGLGLATAYAVIQRHRDDRSELQGGNRYLRRVYLPITLAERREGRAGEVEMDRRPCETLPVVPFPLCESLAAAVRTR